MNQCTESQKRGPELFIGLVGAVGTNLKLVSTTLAESLSEADYDSEIIRISKLLHEIPKWKPLANISKEEKRIEKHMNAGDEFREAIGNDALARLTIGSIRELREAQTEDLTKPADNYAYIIRSLKTPEEVKTLRETYGSGFLLVAAYSPRENRVLNLAREIARSYHKTQIDPFRKDAERLIERDLSDSEKPFGQNVSETFPLADVFIDASEPVRLQESVDRFVEILFGYPYHTPFMDEYAMFHAKAAALRSASLSRQVGAVVTDNNGNVIAVGANEVPKVGGGLVWADDDFDDRDFRQAYDSSDIIKRTTLEEVIDRLKEGGWLSEEKTTHKIEELVDEALKEDNPLLKGTRLMSLIEFGRSVHAEMAAIVDAALRGVNIKDHTIYTTTFPCHDCAKHIVASGIRRVVYIEPYPKSLAPELYPDSIAVDLPEQALDRVNFEPFVGIAPRCYMEMFEFSKGERKDKEGNIIKWVKSEAIPKLVGTPLAYLAKEDKLFKALKVTMERKGLTGSPS